MRRPYFIASFILIVVVFIVSGLLYTRLPETIPTHWNIHGEVDGFSSKASGVFLMPAFLIGIILLFRILPWLSPKQFQVDRFQNTYEYIMFLVVALLATIQCVILWSAFHESENLTRLFPAVLFLFFALMGNVLGKVRRNFWVGIRTPWTLASERVWNDTHRFGAKVFVLVGVTGFVASLLGVPVLVPFILLMASTLVIILYSLKTYKRLERLNEL